MKNYSEKFEKMRKAGSLASSTLDMITDYIKPEFKFSSDTRFDFLCDKNIIEVKNVTLLRDKKIAEFPDAVTERGTKHLKKLIEALKQGYKPFVLFLTQIQGINNLSLIHI